MAFMVVYAKINKIWCCLEHLDLLFTTLRFVFFTQTTTCILSRCFGMLLENMFMFIVQEFQIYLILFATFFEFFIGAEHMSRKTMPASSYESIQLRSYKYVT
jgi:hypothetical protein